MSPLSKTPFLFPLIALISGIILQYYGQNIIWSIITLFLGGVIMLLSHQIKYENQFSYRWLFGVGIFFSFIAVGGFRTSLKQETLKYELSDSLRTYVGFVINTPQNKPRSIACKVYVEKEDVNIVCYLQKDSIKSYPKVGDQIIFVGQLQSFKNRGNPNDFDYQKYMYNQGFVASVFLNSNSWQLTGDQSKSLFIKALKVRQHIMDSFANMGFSIDQQAILSALTLGYQDTLSDDLKQGFRTTGTVHVLSVSGLHVGIIYGLITFLLSFLSLPNRYRWIKVFLVIFFLWAYAFLTGLPPSVVRASVMLTAFCVAEIFNRRGNPLNNLFIAAFIMLLYNPFQFFDIGFQLSCLLVLSILALYPLLYEKFKTKNKILNFVLGMLGVSFSAQLATFPLCLYYFGTFPTYFFVTNIFIVVLVSPIIYGVVLLAFLSELVTFFHLSEIWLWLPIRFLKLGVEIMTQFISFFENLPHALIDKVKISFIGLVLIYFLILSLLMALKNTNSKILILSLCLFIVILTINIIDEINERREKVMLIMNNATETEIILKEDGIEHSLNLLDRELKNPIYELGHSKILIINDIQDLKKISSKPYQVNYAICADKRRVNIGALNEKFLIDTLILDGTLGARERRLLTKECENRKIHIYDVTKKGAYRINF